MNFFIIDFPRLLHFCLLLFRQILSNFAKILIENFLKDSNFYGKRTNPKCARLVEI